MHLLIRGRCLFVMGACALAGCRPSLEVARKTAQSFDERSRAAAIAQLEADRSLIRFEPPLRAVPAADVKPADARDPALRGCLFAVGGDLAYDEASCGAAGPNDGGHRYYRDGTKIVVIRVVSVPAEETNYEDPTCFQAGLSGGHPMPVAPPPDPNAPPSVSPRMLRHLGPVAAADVSIRDVRYPIHVVNRVCTGTYQTLGYPP